MGQRKYTIVYFNTDAELGAIPDTIFFQQMHAALHPTHKRNLKVRFPAGTIGHAVTAD